METINLWGEIKISELRSPKSIIQEQADFLSGATKNILFGEIVEKTFSETSIASIARYSPITKSADIIKYSFVVTAPGMQNYRIQLFEITYSIIEFYPVFINDSINEHEYKANDYDAFIQILGDIIQSESTQKIIQNLIIQSKG